MRYIILSLLLQILLFTFSQAQELTIKDRENGKGIEQVLIYTESQSHFLQTDKNGKAELNELLSDSLFYFQHPAYQNKTVSRRQLQANNYQLWLSPESNQIEAVVISANKLKERPIIVSQLPVITKEEIEHSNPQTSADILSKSGQVYVQKSQQGGGSPMLRGFAANSVLLLMDGVRMNNAIYRGGNLHNVIGIDPLAVERAEVLYGSGSVTYGSDALGGVMHFHTYQPQFHSETTTNTSAMSRYASANNEKTFHADFELSGNRLASWTSISFSDFDDLRSGSNHPDAYPDFGKRSQYVQRIANQDMIIENPEPALQVGSAYRQVNLIQKLRYKASENLKLDYGFYYTNSSDVPRYDRLTEYSKGRLKYAEWYYGPQKWQLHRLQANYTKTTPLFDRLRLLATLQNVEESRHNRKFGSTERRSQIENVRVWGLNLDLTKYLSENIELYYGLEGFYNLVDSKAFYQDIEDGTKRLAETRYPSGGSTYKSLAAYASMRYRMLKNLDLTAGLRYNLIQLNAKSAEELTSIEQFNNAVSVHAGANYRPAKDWELTGSFSTGFRAPNIDDAGKLFSPADGIITVPNPDLRPTYTYNTEAGIVKDFSEHLKIQLTAYHSWLKDVMVRRPFAFQGAQEVYLNGDTLQSRALVNSGQGRIAGISTSVDIKLHQNWQLSTTASWTKGEDQEGNRLRHVAPFFGKTMLSYEHKKFTASFSGLYNGAVPFEKLPPSEKEKTHLYSAGGALAWYTLNLRAAYQLNQHFRINAALENLLDRHYRSYSSGISAPGRNLVLSVKANF